MSEPNVPQKQPYVLELEPGSYAWCACGNSANQPFCDGTHAGTEFTPVQFKLEEKRRVALCGCRHAQNGAAFCDGTHSSL